MSDFYSRLRRAPRNRTRLLLSQASAGLAKAANALEKPGFISKSERALLARNARFSDIHVGTRAFVVGNGPSLQRQDLSRLAGERLFVVNGFWRNPGLAKQPTAICLADPLWFEENALLEEEIASMRAVATTGDFFLPTWGKAAAEARGLFPHDRAFYCKFYDSMETAEGFEFDLTGPIPAVQSVSQFAILVALYMGCNPIYLIGMDHDWLSSPSVAITHFYDPDENAPNTGDSVDHGQTYGQNLEAVAKLWRGYGNLRRVATDNGRQIINATDGGFLDVFERAPYDSLFDLRDQVT